MGGERTKLAGPQTDVAPISTFENTLFQVQPEQDGRWQTKGKLASSAFYYHYNGVLAYMGFIGA